MGDPDASRNEFSGEATHVVQIGNVHGDVHLHPSSPAQRAAAARPYLLLETGEVVGRASLRADIEDFLGGGGTSVLLLIGVPGIGKSALAWDAWKRLRAADRRRFWYSFYDGRGVGSFAGLLHDLVRFLGLADTAGVGEVLDAVAEQEVLLFLDGIERCLRCYQRPLAVGDLDAMRIQESANDLWHDTELSFASDDALRFFQQLTDLPPGRVVATSRVVPADYFASGGALRAGVTSRLVDRLSPEESGALLRAIGTPLTPADAETVASVLGGHPLALQLLARQVRLSLRRPGSLPQWLAAEGYLSVEGAGPQHLRDRLFVRAAAELSRPACMLLVITGVLGGSIDLPTLRELDPSGLTDWRFHQAVEEIAASGLGVTTSGGELGCHPLTASAAGTRLAAAETTELVRALEETLRGRFTDMDHQRAGYAEWFARSGTADRAEAMALCRALVRLGEWEQAAELYAEQLDLPVRLVLGANFEAVEVLRSIVANLDDKGVVPPDHLRPSLAHHLLMIGRIDEAEEVLDAMSGGEYWHETRMVRTGIAFHRGDVAAALEHAVEALHEARAVLAHLGAEYLEFALAEGSFDMLSSRPTSNQIEALSWCARLLMLAGRPGEAAVLLGEGWHQWQLKHSHCDGCHGLLIRAAAELLAVCGHAEAAVSAAATGAALQAEQGRTLQGLLSAVVVGVRSRQPAAEVTALLGDSGFVLYQLLLQAAAGSSRASDALVAAGCRSLPVLLGNEPTPSVPAELVSRCAGWVAGEPGPAAEWLEPEIAEVVAKVAEIAATAAVPETSAACLDNAETLLRSGDHAAAEEALKRASEIDPCSDEALGSLARLAARQGDLDTALDHLRMLFFVCATADTYDLAAELVPGPGPFANAVRKLLEAMADSAHESYAARQALAELSRRLGDEPPPAPLPPRRRTLWTALFSRRRR